MIARIRNSNRRRGAGRRGADRLGAEIVELAFALPVMSIIIFGTLELCEVIFVKQSLAVATYEAGRVAGRPGTTSAMVEARFNDILNSRRGNSFTLTITPPEVSSASMGDQIRLVATAPITGNASTNMVLAGVPDILDEVVVVRE